MGPTPRSLPTVATRSCPADFLFSDFWFRDGNLVITSDQAIFKVHHGQLERHSEVFRDMFSIPQPSHPDMIDECISVQLYDSPSDLFYFLKAVYDGLYFHTPRVADFPCIVSVLRMSTKYIVEHLRQRCLTQLELDWPTTLAGWDRREQDATDKTGRYVPRESCPHPIFVIELALELGIVRLLPSALYDLSRYGPSKIMAGAPRLAIAPDLPLTLASLQTSNDLPIRLSLTWLCRTFRGREAAQKYMAAFIEKELRTRQPSPDCIHRQERESPSQVCQESFYFITLNILRSVGGIACGRDADPLYTLVQAMDMLSRTDFSDGEQQCGLKLCQPCKADFATSAAKAREEVWELLPSWFGLDDWEKIHAL